MVVSGWDLWASRAFAGLLAGGLALQATALFYFLRGKPYPPRRAPLRLAVMGAVTLVAAGCAKALVAQSPTASALEVNNARHFESARDPALKLVAPPGWTLSYDRSRRSLNAIQGSGPEDAAVTLNITTDLSQEEVDTAAFQQGLLGSLAEQGLTEQRPPVSVTVGGLPASHFVAKKPGDQAELCSWRVRRGRRYAAHLTCVARAGGCEAACQPALSALTWLRPSDIDADDLR